MLFAVREGSWLALAQNRRMGRCAAHLRIADTSLSLSRFDTTTADSILLHGRGTASPTAFDRGVSVAFDCNEIVGSRATNP
jgi:hypothetical protein